MYMQEEEEKEEEETTMKQIQLKGVLVDLVKKKLFIPYDKYARDLLTHNHCHRAPGRGRLSRASVCGVWPQSGNASILAERRSWLKHQ